MITAILIIFTCFCLFALYAVISGELIRTQQKGQVMDYVIRKKSVLMQIREQEKRQREREKQEEELKKIKFEIPEDEKLAKDLQFLYGIAAQSPKIIANVIRLYLEKEKKNHRFLHMG